jgi:hypothetical protein
MKRWLPLRIFQRYTPSRYQKDGVMKFTLDEPVRPHCRPFLKMAMVWALALSMIGCGAASDATSQARTKRGTVPEFHPELGLSALHGYLDPKALPDSLALIPPPPVPGSAAFATVDAPMKPPHITMKQAPLRGEDVPSPLECLQRFVS